MSDKLPYYDFGAFRLDVEQCQLILRSRKPKIVKLEPKVCEVLILLVRRQGKVVTKDEFISAVWNNDLRADDANITRAISTLRKAMNGLKRNSKYILTVPKRGYRLVGDDEMQKSNQKILPYMSDNEPSISQQGVSDSSERIELSRRAFNVFLLNLTNTIALSPGPLNLDLDRSINKLPEGTDIFSVIIGKRLAQRWEEEAKSLMDGGITMSRGERKICTDALLELAKGVLIVDSKCLNPQTQWSKYWRDWFTDLKSRTDITRKYCITYTSPISDLDADNLLATWDFLRSVGIQLTICDISHLQDSLGKHLPQFASLNIFGNIIMHINIPPQEYESKQFSGGQDLEVKLRDTNQDSVYREIHRLIELHSKKVTPKLIKELQKGA